MALVGHSTLLRRETARHARSALITLEADPLAEKNPHQERVRLAEGWRQLETAVKLGRRRGGVVREEREEATRKTKELLDGATRDAEEAARRLEEAEATEKAFMERAAAREAQLALMRRPSPGARAWWRSRNWTWRSRSAGSR